MSKDKNITKSKFIMFDEEVVKVLYKIIEMVDDVKTRFDHVRGEVENREIMKDALSRAIDIIEQKDYTQEMVENIKNNSIPPCASVFVPSN